MIIDSIENKRKILDNFLEICVFEGVNNHALKKAFEKAEIDYKYQELIFENGVLDLIKFYISQISENLSEKIKKEQDFANFKIRDKIKFCLYDIFDQQKDHQIAAKRIFNFYFDIKNLKSSEYGVKSSMLAFKNLLRLSDKIWYLIGDKSTDYNYYTKRLILAKIIAKSFFKFTKDESENLEDTKELIDAEIEKVMQFEKIKAKIKNSDLKNHCQNARREFKEIFFDKNLRIRKPQEILKKLPFFRLFN